MNSLKSHLNVLYIEDEKEDLQFLKTIFFKKRIREYSLSSASCFSDGLDLLLSNFFDICLSDLSLPDAHGLEIITKIKKASPHTALIVVSSNQDEKTAYQSLKSGAHDYLIKGEFDEKGLSRTIRYALERCQSELELKKARNRAEGASNAKSRFLANMSHEIRTPLNAIIGISDLMTETQLDSQQSKYVEMLNRSGKHLLDLINNILDLSKIEAGEAKVESHAFDLVELVEGLADVSSVTCRSKGLDFCLSIEPKGGIQVTSDEGKIRQTLFNLIGNAIKFTEKGNIHLCVEAIPEKSKKKGLLRFVVSDTGIGVHKEKLQEIFRDFGQADSTITRKFGGTGLGLSISKRFVEMLGGKILFESVEGEGTAITVEVPATIELGKKASSDIDMDLSSCQVLIIDDNPLEQEILKSNLSYFGVNKFKIFSNGRDAVAFIQENGDIFDLYFIDCRMPVMGGFETLREISKTHDISSKTVLMLPSGHRAKDFENLKEWKLNYYFVKPIKSSSVRSFFEEFFRKKSKSEKRLSKDSLSSRIAKPLHILIAEDMDENRFLMNAYFRDSSHQIQFANDGKIAVDLWQRGKFDIILMDIQMPNMDGYSATKRIRDLELKEGRSKTPIVALTAHAFKEEIQNALLAGCDDCVSKPVTKSKIFEKIEEFIVKYRPGKETRMDSAPQKMSTDVSDEKTPVLDHQHLEQYRELDIPGEPSVIIEMAKKFIEAAPERLDAIQKAIQTSNAKGLRYEAHSLKGSSGNMGAKRLYSICQKLEQMGEKGKLEEARSSTEALVKEYHLALGEVKKLVA